MHGNNYKAYLRFEGITVKNFAKSNVPLFSLGYAAIAFDFRNVHQVVFSNCNFAYNNFHLSFGGTCDDLLIQACSFKDETGLWSHGMLKNQFPINLFSYLHRLPDNLKTVPCFLKTEAISRSGHVF